VLRHVSDSSERTTARLRREMEKEREMTAKRLRRYYINSLSKLLEKEYDWYITNYCYFFVIVLAAARGVPFSVTFLKNVM